jgi:hypothetical protein
MRLAPPRDPLISSVVLVIVMSFAVDHIAVSVAFDREESL